jgi:hypothetical protein
LGQVATIIKGSNAHTMAYADRILAGISPEQFRRMPPGINTNSPAFNFGHLALYPERLLAMLGREDLARPDEKWEELFNAKAVCKDDPDGTIYPPMEQIVARFRDRHKVLMEVISETKDEVFAKPNPNEQMASRFPTIGVLANFLLTAHIMMHMGQTSTWRRVMGLPAA